MNRDETPVHNRTVELTSTELAEKLDLPPTADVYAVEGVERWVFHYTVPKEDDQ